MQYDYSKLWGAIAERYGTQSKFSKAIGISEHSISQKMNCKIGWKQSEILRICELLNIPHKDISKYFFTLKVQKN